MPGSELRERVRNFTADVVKLRNEFQEGLEDKISSNPVKCKKPEKPKTGMDSPDFLKKIDSVNMSDYLRGVVRGHDAELDDISEFFDQHYIDQHLSPASDTKIKNNLLLCGPTGSGKTHTMKAVSKYLDVPFFRFDSTILTEEGYVGESARTMLWNYLKECKFDVSRAETGIIFIDEIDSKKFENNPNSSGFSRDAVIKALLNMIEGDTIEVKPPEKQEGGYDEKDVYKLNTRKIAFVFGGAFDDAYREIEKSKDKVVVGFVEPKSDKEKIVNELILPRYFGREVIGRWTNKVFFGKLAAKDYYDILKNTKDSIFNQKKRTYEDGEKVHGYDLKFEMDDDALMRIAEEAEKMNEGARSLESLFKKVIGRDITDLKRNAHKTGEYKIEYKITKKLVEERLAA